MQKCYQKELKSQSICNRGNNSNKDRYFHIEKNEIDFSDEIIKCVMAYKCVRT